MTDRGPEFHEMSVGEAEQLMPTGLRLTQLIETMPLSHPPSAVYGINIGIQLALAHSEYAMWLLRTINREMCSATGRSPDEASWIWVAEKITEAVPAEEMQ